MDIMRGSAVQCEELVGSLLRLAQAVGKGVVVVMAMAVMAHVDAGRLPCRVVEQAGQLQASKVSRGRLRARGKQWVGWQGRQHGRAAIVA